MYNIQITIDDGPLDEDSLTLMLEELKRRSLIAIFFVLGQEIQDDGRNLKKIIQAGHVIGNHTWDHLPNSNYSAKELLANFQKTHDRVRKVIGYDMKYWRMPKLARDRIGSVTPLMVGEGKLYQMTHCDNHLDTKDALGSVTAEQMLACVRNSFDDWPPRTFYRLLFHVKPTTVLVWAEVLDDLVRQGHTLVNFKQTS